MKRGESLTTGSVKICGIREPGLAMAAADAGADLIGFIFAPGRRQVSAGHAADCINQARGRAGERYILAVGVFVDEDAGRINEIAKVAGLDLVQLNGDEPPGMLAQLDLPAIKAFRPRPGQAAVEVDHLIRAYRANVPEPVALLLDGYDPVYHGGHGKRADWSVGSQLAKKHTLMLAGGLTPDNVGQAISQVRPIAVDVSSGVETDGAKDPEKIRAFIAAAKRAFALETPRSPESS
jgi:phosphoribosylanthranilate isomerase